MERSDFGKYKQYHFQKSNLHERYIASLELNEDKEHFKYYESSLQSVAYI